MLEQYAQSKIIGQPRPEDPTDLRIGHSVKSIDLKRDFELIQAGDFVVLGYPDDRGVDRCGGRPGSAEAPHMIRQWLYKMTPSARFSGTLKIWDIGNFKSWGLPLLEAQENAKKMVEELRKIKARILSLGGGHDWAYSDFAGFLDPATNSTQDSPHLINFDAHLDMRPVPAKSDLAGHSGTPFRRLLEAPLVPPVQMSVVGLQEHCNAASHLQWAQGHRVTPIFLEDLPLSLGDQWTLLTEKLGLQQTAKRYGISIDMDAFSQSDSPGVSAPQPLGLEPRLVDHILRQIGPKTAQLGIYETNPGLDRDGASSRLAARFAFRFLMS